MVGSFFLIIIKCSDDGGLTLSLTRLPFLELGYNSLNGTIPTEIGKLQNLTVLNLGTCAFFYLIFHILISTEK